MNLDRTGYSGRIYSPAGLRSHAQFVKDQLASRRDKFDFVAVTGKSGMAVAFAALALGADFDLVTIRKGESSHGQLIEGRATGPRYVVIDDMIDSGATLDRIADELRKFASGRSGIEEPHMVAVLLYSSSSYTNGWQVSGQDEPVPVLGQRSYE